MVSLCVIYFPRIELKEVHSEPRQHGVLEMLNGGICFVEIRVSQQDKEIYGVDGAGQAALSGICLAQEWTECVCWQTCEQDQGLRLGWI